MTTIFEAAEAAWKKAPDSAAKVTFKWRGAKYVSNLSFFAMRIEDTRGNLIAKKFHDF